MESFAKDYNLNKITPFLRARNSIIALGIILAASLVSGCGGGGSDNTQVSSNSLQPVAISDESSTPQNTPATFSVTENDQIQVELSYVLEIDRQPSHGSVTVEPNDSVTYLPEAGFVGIDNFTYTIQDSRGNSTTATVTIKVFCEACPEINLTLDWKDNLEVDGYLIYYGDSPNATPLQVADTPVALYEEDLGRTFGLYGGETVCFWVRSYSNSGISPFSDPVCGTA